MTISLLKKDLRKYINEEKKEFLPKFFKTGKGEYGEGDKFLGIVVPDIAKVAKKYSDLTKEDIRKLLNYFLISISCFNFNFNYRNNLFL